MNANEYTIRMAESYEKAAIQAQERGDQHKALECWAKAGDGFVESEKLARAIECFKKAGILEDRAIQLVTSTASESVLAVLEAHQLTVPAALARLYLLSTDCPVHGRPAHTACLEAAVTAQDHILQRHLLTGAMLSAAWSDDMAALAVAADAIARVDSTALETATLAKIAATLDFDLVIHLEETLSGRKRSRASAYTPDELRLLAPIHAWRGIRLTPVIDAMSAFPATRQVSQEYRQLIAGLEGGDPDDAVTRFVNGLKGRASWPDPAHPIRGWHDVSRALSSCFHLQPEAITVAILSDQLWALRAGVREAQELTVAASRAAEQGQWSMVFERLDALRSNRVVSYLPAEKQVEILRLGCCAAYSAEQWDRYDAWATVLEDRFDVKDVLRDLLNRMEA